MVAEEVLVTLSGGAPWGFRLQGGVEHQAPLQVSKVRRRSKACRAGLREEDELVSIGDCVCVEFSHAQAMTLIDSHRHTLNLRVKRSGCVLSSVEVPGHTNTPTVTQTYTHPADRAACLTLTSPPDSEAYYGETDSDVDTQTETHRRQRRTPPHTRSPGRQQEEEEETSEMSGYESAPDGGGFLQGHWDKPTPTENGGIQKWEQPTGSGAGFQLGVPRREVFFQPQLPQGQPDWTHTAHPVPHHEEGEPSVGGEGEGDSGFQEAGACISLACPPLVSPERAKGAMMLGSSRQMVPMVGVQLNPVSDELSTTYKDKARQAKLQRGDTVVEKQVKEARTKCRSIASLLTDSPNPNSKGVLMFKKRRQRAKKYTLTCFGQVEGEIGTETEGEDEGNSFPSGSEVDEEDSAGNFDPTWDSGYLDLLDRRSSACPSTYNSRPQTPTNQCSKLDPSDYHSLEMNALSNQVSGISAPSYQSPGLDSIGYVGMEHFEQQRNFDDAIKFNPAPNPSPAAGLSNGGSVGVSRACVVLTPPSHTPVLSEPTPDPTLPGRMHNRTARPFNAGLSQSRPPATPVIFRPLQPTPAITMVSKPTAAVSMVTISPARPSGCPQARRAVSSTSLYIPSRPPPSVLSSPPSVLSPSSSLASAPFSPICSSSQPFPDPSVYTSSFSTAPAPFSPAPGQTFSSNPGQHISSTPGQTFSSTPGQTFSTPGQHISSTPGQHFSSTPGQTFSTPGQHISSTPGQHFSSTPGQTFSSTPGQTLSSTPGQHLSSTPGQHFSSTPGQTFSSTPGQHLSSTPGQHFSSTPGQTFSSTPGQHFSSTPGQTFSSTPGQHFSSTPGQTFSSTPGQTSSTPGQTFSSTPGQHFSSTPGQTSSTPGQHFCSTPGQTSSTPGQTFSSTPGQHLSSTPGQTFSTTPHTPAYQSSTMSAQHVSPSLVPPPKPFSGPPSHLSSSSFSTLSSQPPCTAPPQTSNPYGTVTSPAITPLSLTQPPASDSLSSREQRIAVPASRTGILAEARRRGNSKPMFRPAVDNKDVSPNPALLELLQNPDTPTRIGPGPIGLGGVIDTGAESGPEDDWLRLGAEACNFLQTQRGTKPPPVAPKPQAPKQVPQLAGKGGQLFARRQSRMDRYVVESAPSSPQPPLAPLRQASPTPSLPAQFKYSSSCRAPPPISYNPLLSPSCPLQAQRQRTGVTGQGGPQTMRKTAPGGPKAQGVKALDFMTYQPYQLNSSLFSYGGGAPQPAPGMTSGSKMPRVYEVKRFSTPPPTGPAPTIVAPRSATTLGEPLWRSDVLSPPPTATSYYPSPSMSPYQPYPKWAPPPAPTAPLPQLPSFSSTHSRKPHPSQPQTPQQGNKQFKSVPDLSSLGNTPLRPASTQPSSVPRPRFSTSNLGLQASVWRPGSTMH